MKHAYLEAGRVVGTHGVRGELRVQPWCDSPGFLTGFSRFYLDPQGSASLAVLGARAHKNMVLLRVEGVDSIDAAEALRGKVLYISREAVRLPEGRYFVADLVGCTVTHADTGEALGVLTQVSQTGANDVWHITREGKEYLVPAIPDVIVSVDVDAGVVTLRPLEGIFDAD